MRREVLRSTSIHVLYNTSTLKDQYCTTPVLHKGSSLTGYLEQVEHRL